MEQRRGSPYACAGPHCFQWPRILTMVGMGARKEISLALGIISVCSWGVAEVPQIVTHYQLKKTDGLSPAFLAAWIIGDIFNLIGCLLEPETLPSQFYMALLYTATTLVIIAQTIYYGLVYPCLKTRSANQCVEEHKSCDEEKLLDKRQIRPIDDENYASIDKEHGLTTANFPIPVSTPTIINHGSPRRGMYYMSARHLSTSPVPATGSWLSGSLQNSVPIHEDNAIKEPFLENIVPESTPPASPRRMLCVVSSVLFFLGITNFHISMKSTLKAVPQGMVVSVGRKLLQENMVHSPMLRHIEVRAIVPFLGWAMAVIYMGGRLPQIFLNIKRGKVEGLNHFMFIFALIGNLTYVGSILVNTLEWSRIKPNLPWLVDAGGCILLDTFILLQFAYYRTLKVPGRRHEHGAAQ